MMPKKPREFHSQKPTHIITVDDISEYYVALATLIRDTSNIAIIDTLPREGIARVVEQLLQMAMALAENPVTEPEALRAALLVCRILDDAPLHLALRKREAAS